MLDIFLKVAHEHESKQAHSLELAKALSHLPVEELKKLARTGEIKLASAWNWSAQFKNTELYTKAIELEAESLQKTASVDTRVKQRLLELKKEALSNATLGSYAKAQTNPQGLASASKSLMGRGAQLIGSGDAAAGAKKVNQGNLLARKATAVTPMPTMAKAAAGTMPMGMPARPPNNAMMMQARPASAAMGSAKAMPMPAPPPAAMPTTVSRGAPVQQMPAYTPPGQSGNVVPGQGDHRTARAPAPRDPSNAPHREMGAVHRAHPYVPQVVQEKDPFAKSASMQWADEAGRIFARNDMAKLADTTSLLKTLKPHAGAIIGGGLGALHGLAKKDGGIGDALIEGTAGAAVGSGAQRLAKHPEVTGLVDKAKDYLAKGKPGEQLSLDKIGAAMRASRMQKEAMGAFLAAGAKAIPGLLGAAKSALPAAAKAVPAVAEAAAPAAKAGGGLVSQGMDWLKNNKIKAGISAVQGVQAVKASRDSGEGLGSSLMSGLASAAPTALA